MSIPGINNANNEREFRDQNRTVQIDTFFQDFEAIFEQIERISRCMDCMIVRRGILSTWLDILRLIASRDAVYRADVATSLHLPSRTRS